MREKMIIRLGNLNGYTGGSFSGMVYAIYGLSPSINTAGGGNRMPIILEFKDERICDSSKSWKKSY